MKRLIVIIIIIIAILAVLYVFKDQINWQSTYEQVNPTTSGSIPTPPTDSGDNASTSNEEAPSDVVYVADHFAQLASDFDTDAPFRINGIWLQDNAMFYVDYANAKNVESQILVVKENGSFVGKGYFSPGEAGWVLQAGEGDLMKANALFYEKDTSGKWIRKN